MFIFCILIILYCYNVILLYVYSFLFTNVHIVNFFFLHRFYADSHDTFVREKIHVERQHCFRLEIDFNVTPNHHLINIGLHFVTKFLSIMCTLASITHLNISECLRKSGDQATSLNKFILASLRIYVREHKKDWENHETINVRV